MKRLTVGLFGVALGLTLPNAQRFTTGNSRAPIIVNLVSSISPSTRQPYGIVCDGVADAGAVLTQALNDYTQPWWVKGTSYSIGQTVMSHDGNEYTSLVNRNTTNPAFGLNSSSWTNIGPPAKVIFRLPPAPANCHMPDLGLPGPNGFSTCGPFRANGIAKIYDLTFIGDGTELSGDNIRFGCGQVITQDNASPNYSKIQTVAKRAGCVTTTTAGNAANFIPGNWVVLLGFMLQQSSFPPNNTFFEYRQIYSADPGTGDVCFTEALTNGYKSTWPEWTNGGNLMTGSATMIQMFDGWDATITWQGTVNHPMIWFTGANNGTVRSFTATNVHCVYDVALNQGDECFNTGMSWEQTFNNYTD